MIDPSLDEIQSRKEHFPSDSEHHSHLHSEKDYDCFYAAVWERRNPSLKSLPLAIQQKQIIVTCNYEARKRGLYKLQLVREARMLCPDVIIVLGEDLTLFRNASKENYEFLRRHAWSDKVERLGFDEVNLGRLPFGQDKATARSAESMQVFIDVSDLVDYNTNLLNPHHLESSFFQLSRSDPTTGFDFDASAISGHTLPGHGQRGSLATLAPDDPDNLSLRLRLGSHLAHYLRHKLEHEQGYTSTVGVSTNKLLSKLVGNVNKPAAQTTLIPPYHPNLLGESSVTSFIDSHDIGQIPGIGFKTAQVIRNRLLGREAAFDTGLVYGGTKERVGVKEVRLLSEMGPRKLRALLDGPGVPKDLPLKVWGLLNGVDNTEVGMAKEVPQQISIEDSYIRLDTMSEVVNQLTALAKSLLSRMQSDLRAAETESDEAERLANPAIENKVNLQRPGPRRHWIAHPKTLRLSTRPRAPLKPDGTRSRTFARMSKSIPMPTFVFAEHEPVEVLAQRLVEEVLVPLFHRLHAGQSGWDLSLVNICATNMAMTASDGKNATGRDISKMFRQQEGMLKEWQVEDADIPPEGQVSSKSIDPSKTESPPLSSSRKPTYAATGGSEDFMSSTQESFVIGDAWEGTVIGDAWEGTEDDEAGSGKTCGVCNAVMPAFAMVAHLRFHDMRE